MEKTVLNVGYGLNTKYNIILYGIHNLTKKERLQAQCYSLEKIFRHGLHQL